VRARAGTGIPVEATHFCFIYPSEQGALCHERLTKASRRNEWGFLLLLGGFAYFDKGHGIICINAISPGHTATGLSLRGPLLCEPSFYERFVTLGRTHSVTIPDMVALGFRQFGWVNPSEELDGLTLSDEHAYPMGAFVYRCASFEDLSTTRFIFYALVPSSAHERRVSTAHLSKMGSSRNLGALATGMAKQQEAADSAADMKSKLHHLGTTKHMVKEGPKQAGNDEQATPLAERIRSELLLAAARFLKLCAFIGVGTVFYHHVERHECVAVAVASEGSLDAPGDFSSGENSMASSGDGGVGGGGGGGDIVGGGDVGGGLGGGLECPFWTYSEALYFSMITISTVGYGDYAPATTAGRLFAVAYIIAGVYVLTSTAGELVATLFNVLEAAFFRSLRACRRGCRRAPPSMVPLELSTSSLFSDDVDDVDTDEREQVLQRPLHFYAGKLGFRVIFGFTFVLVFSSYFCTLAIPIGYGDALWLSFITASTVGYGDITITPMGQTWALVHTFLSVSWLASLLELMSTSRNQYKFEVQRHKLISAQLSEELIEQLDPMDQGLDKATFVGRMLISMGAELCGQPIDFEDDVLPLLQKFEALDADSSGKLTRDDLSFMVSEAQRGHGRHSTLDVERRSARPRRHLYDRADSVMRWPRRAVARQANRSAHPESLRQPSKIDVRPSSHNLRALMLTKRWHGGRDGPSSKAKVQPSSPAAA